jgi:hypothetical protein
MAETPPVPSVTLVAMTPNTHWSEVIGADEEQRHARLAEQVVAVQARINARRGPGRAFHRKPIAGLRGTLHVPELLPEYAAQGLFAKPGLHEAYVRMSNGAVVPQPDALPDIRGFAFSVRGLKGPAALGGTTDRQDFLLINFPNFGFEDSQDFADIVGPASRGQVELVRFLISKYGLIKGPLEMARVVAAQSRPFSGFATASFHSCAPVAWGPYAAWVHVEPVGASRNLLAWRDYGADIRNRLDRSPLTWRVQAQFYTSDSATPIEDGRVTWKSEKVTVGTLTCDEIVDVESDHFDPWSALVEHRPLGEIMRARKAAYYPSFKNRT